MLPDDSMQFGNANVAHVGLALPERLDRANFRCQMYLESEVESVRNSGLISCPLITWSLSIGSL
ncbi:hypothetical protein N9A76_03570 [Mariniblastus sp.]|nr:hypothetical protein [Mariniblastus sp.]